MALGGFQRALKLSSSLVVDHRPVGHADAQGADWLELTVPANIPLSLNEGIAAGLLSVVDGKLTWPDDARDLHDEWLAGKLLEAQQKPSEVDVLKEEIAELKALLVDKKVLSSADLEEASK